MFLLQVAASHAVGTLPGSCAEVALCVACDEECHLPTQCFEMCAARPPHSTPDPLAQMFPMEDRGEDDGDRVCVWASLRSGIAGETVAVMSVPCPTGEWGGAGGSSSITALYVVLEVGFISKTD